MNKYDEIQIATFLRLWRNALHENQNVLPIKDLKYILLCDDVIGLTTYDGSISLSIGKEIHEIMLIIYERKTYEYIAIKVNYIKYIKTINYFGEWLDWGTSIRGAWFDTSDAIELQNYNFECISITDGFLKWFLYEFMGNNHDKD